MKAGIVDLSLALALSGSALADVYQDNFNSTVVPGSSLGLSGTGVGNGQCSELTCNSNYYSVDSIAGWSFSPAVYGYAYNTTPPASLAVGNGPYDNVAILLNENGSGQIATLTNTISGLTVGKTYNLTFQYWGDNEPYSSQGTYSFDVSVNGNDTLFKQVQNTGLGSGNSNAAAISFVASASTTNLIFTQDTRLYGGDSASPIIDNIDVKAANQITGATPEPGFYGLLALALAALVTVHSRRKYTRKA